LSPFQEHPLKGIAEITAEETADAKNANPRKGRTAFLWLRVEESNEPKSRGAQDPVETSGPYTSQGGRKCPQKTVRGEHKPTTIRKGTAAQLLKGEIPYCLR